MESALTLGSADQQLGLRFKKLFLSDSDVGLKVKGVLNTVTAQCEVTGELNKFFRLGSLKPHDPNEAYQPDTRLRLGLGLKASGVGGKTYSADDVLLSVSAKKKLAVQRSQEVVRGRLLLRNYTQASVAANYDYNIRTEQWGGEVHAHLSHAIFRFTDDQDVRVTAGVRAPLTQQGVGAAQPYLRVQENCWALTVQPDGQWRVSYDL
ncbi:outer envelope pore isoform A [Chlorella sorokiniana]|uniref:Outer envelope pore isoform A n=2 Tax=Chlorella sorokiniana TaxID=3076 RepID=A0A2P6TUE2_CHLSO|nr:outer envelope pore isoform A [Chlorella sorokiniana]|eukprot:PRW57685.1 outer envelope pore isoform A [Chlorella sorokiniana]